MCLCRARISRSLMMVTVFRHGSRFPESCGGRPKAGFSLCTDLVTTSRFLTWTCHSSLFVCKMRTSDQSRWSFRGMSLPTSSLKHIWRPFIVPWRITKRGRKCKTNTQPLRQGQANGLVAGVDLYHRVCAFHRPTGVSRRFRGKSRKDRASGCVEFAYNFRSLLIIALKLQYSHRYFFVTIRHPTLPSLPWENAISCCISSAKALKWCPIIPLWDGQNINLATEHIDFYSIL